MKKTVLSELIRANPWPGFAVILFLVCFLISAVVPPFQSPDEWDHLKRAYLLTRGQIILDAPAGKASGGMIDSGLAAYISLHADYPFNPGKKVSLNESRVASSIKWSGKKEFSAAPGTGYYFPVIYAPQAMGLAIGEIFGLSVDTSYRLARFCSLLTVSLALLVSFLVYRPSPLVVSLLLIPMSLFQMASTSLDGISSALSILAISLFMKISGDKERADSRLLFALATCVFLVAASRVHLAPLVGLIFFTHRQTKPRHSLLAGAAVSLLILIWVAIALGTTVDTRIVAGLPTSSIIAYYLLHPFAFIRVVYSTLSNPDILSFYQQSFLGILGWLDARFQNQFYATLNWLLLPVALLSISFKELQHHWRERAALFLCAMGSVGLIFFALLVTWNPHPASYIEGIQGRYFLIPALLLAYSLKSGPAIESSSYRLAGLVMVVATGLYSAYGTVSLLLQRYYVSL